MRDIVDFFNQKVEVNLLFILIIVCALFLLLLIVISLWNNVSFLKDEVKHISRIERINSDHNRDMFDLQISLNEDFLNFIKNTNRTKI